jgi:hypothetical protein
VFGSAGSSREVDELLQELSKQLEKAAPPALPPPPDGAAKTRRVRVSKASQAAEHVRVKTPPKFRPGKPAPAPARPAMPVEVGPRGYNITKDVASGLWGSKVPAPPAPAEDDGGKASRAALLKEASHASVAPVAEPDPSSSLQEFRNPARTNKPAPSRPSKEEDKKAEWFKGPYCSCMATVHGLWTNCLHCGKILCDREAGRACSWCGEEMTHVKPGKKSILAARKRASDITLAFSTTLLSEHARATANSRYDARLKGGKREVLSFEEALSGITDGWKGSAFETGEGEHASAPHEEEDEELDAPEIPEALRRAIQHKNRLLEFDRTSEARTKVYDDQSDYFGGAGDSSVWLSSDEAAVASAAENARRKALHHIRPLTMTLDVDFGSGVVRVSDLAAEEAKARREQLAESIRTGAAQGSSAWDAAKEQGARSAAQRLRDHEEERRRAQEQAAAAASASGLELPENNASLLAGRAAEVYRALLNDSMARRSRAMESLSDDVVAPRAARRGALQHEDTLADKPPIAVVSVPVAVDEPVVPMHAVGPPEQVRGHTDVSLFALPIALPDLEWSTLAPAGQYRERFSSASPGVV